MEPYKVGKQARVCKSTTGILAAFAALCSAFAASPTVNAEVLPLISTSIPPIQLSAYARLYWRGFVDTGGGVRQANLDGSQDWEITQVFDVTEGAITAVPVADTFKIRSTNRKGYWYLDAQRTRALPGVARPVPAEGESVVVREATGAYSQQWVFEKVQIAYTPSPAIGWASGLSQNLIDERKNQCERTPNQRFLFVVDGPRELASMICRPSDIGGTLCGGNNAPVQWVFVCFSPQGEPTAIRIRQRDSLMYIAWQDNRFYMTSDKASAALFDRSYTQHIIWNDRAPVGVDGEIYKLAKDIAQVVYSPKNYFEVPKYYQDAPPAVVPCDRGGFSLFFCSR